MNMKVAFLFAEHNLESFGPTGGTESNSNWNSTHDAEDGDGFVIVLVVVDESLVKANVPAGGRGRGFLGEPSPACDK